MTGSLPCRCDDRTSLHIAEGSPDSRSAVRVALTSDQSVDRRLSDPLKNVNGAQEKSLIMESDRSLNGIKPWRVAKRLSNFWCGRRDLNPHAIGMTQDFKSWVSADSTTPAAQNCRGEI